MLNWVRLAPWRVATIGLSAVCVVALAAFYFSTEPFQGREPDSALASSAIFGQVAEQWDAQMRRDGSPTTQDMQDFAETKNLQWG